MILLGVLGFIFVVVVTWWVDHRLEIQASEIRRIADEGKRLSLEQFTARELRDEIERRESEVA